MALLKKIRSATLVESLVATVIIVIIFIGASLILNNLLLNTISKNNHSLETRLNELEYQIRTAQIETPYQETFRNFDISVTRGESDRIKIGVTNERSGTLTFSKIVNAGEN